MRIKVLILHATGTNRDHEAACACELAGGVSEIVHVNQIRAGERSLLDYQMLVLPGGFSYSDDLGAGRLWAIDLLCLLRDQLERFIESGRPVIGICNGFQALVKAGLLPGLGMATLMANASGHFECRWVTLQATPASPCVFTRNLTEPIFCPVAHGEGRFAIREKTMLAELMYAGQVALTYVSPNGGQADYPDNPNGSVADIAGVCNPAGNVFGLMPHPEDHVFPWQHPRWSRGERGRMGLKLFENGIQYARRTS
jgi:phosphoribosylformylglycinamidine synthase subunit PurQ / glutaminase